MIRAKNRRKGVYAFTLLLFFFGAAFFTRLAAQEEFIDPLSKRVTSVPFTQITGGVVILKALLGSFPDTLNFILDSGSSGISLDSTTSADLKLEATPTQRTIRGIAGIRKVSFIFDQQLHFPGLTIDSLDFHINDYSILTAVYGIRIDGIIGYSVISRYILKLDYDSLKLSFCTPGTIRYPKGGYLLKPAINMLVAQQMRVSDARTISTRFLFDLGAGLCMLFSKDFTQDSNFLDKKRKYWVKEAQGLGGKLNMNLRVIKEVKLGPYRFRKVPSFVFDDETNVTSYPYMGGLVGNDLLRRFNVILNYRKGDIYITPNSHYNDPFDYAYTGLELYLINGVIVVGNVAKGSPADEAGIKEGDEVLAVNKIFSKDLNKYKTELQAANQKVKLILHRDEQILEVEFKVLSILQGKGSKKKHKRRQ